MNQKRVVKHPSSEARERAVLQRFTEAMKVLDAGTRQLRTAMLVQFAAHRESPR